MIHPQDPQDLILAGERRDPQELCENFEDHGDDPCEKCGWKYLGGYENDDR